MFNQNQAWPPKALAHRRNHFLSVFCDCQLKNVAKAFWLVVFGLGVGASGRAQSIDTLFIPGPVCTGNSTPIFFSTTGMAESWNMWYNSYKLEVVDSATSLAGAANYAVFYYQGSWNTYLPITLGTGRKKARLILPDSAIFSDSVYFTMDEPKINFNYYQTSVYILGANGNLGTPFTSALSLNSIPFTFQQCGMSDSIIGYFSDSSGSFENPIKCPLVYIPYTATDEYYYRPNYPKGLPTSSGYRFKIGNVAGTVFSSSVASVGFLKGELSTTNAHLCVGDSATITSLLPEWAINNGYGTGYRYRWFRHTPNSLDSTESNSNAYTAKAGGQYYAKILTEYEFWDVGRQVVTFTDTITIHEGPCPRFSISLEGTGQTITGENSYTLCNNANVQVLLTGQAEYASVNNFTYRYSWDGGTWLDTLTPVDSLVSILTWQSGLLRIRPILSSGFVADTALLNITFLPALSAHFQLDTVACAASLIALDTNSRIDGSEQISYTWTAPGANNENPSWNWTNWTGEYLNYATAGNHKVKLEITDLSYGCNAVDSVEFTTTNFQVHINPPTTKADSTAMVFASVSNSTIIPSFYWNTGTCLNTTCDTILISGLSGAITLEVQDTHGCIATDTLSSVPFVQIYTPSQGDTVEAGNILIHANATGSISDIAFVRFYLDSAIIQTDSTLPYMVSYSGTEGDHIIRAQVVDLLGNSSFSENLAVYFKYQTNDDEGALLQSLAEDDPEIMDRLNAFEENFNNYIALQKDNLEKFGFEKNGNQEIITIPVVFGIIDNTSGTISAYVTDSLIARNLRLVNQIYRNNKIHTPNGIKYIQFCLAKKRPDDSAFNGIVRITNNALSKFPGSSGHSPRLNAVLGQYSYLNYLRIVVCDRTTPPQNTTRSDAYLFSYNGGIPSVLQNYDGVYMHYTHLGPGTGNLNNSNRGPSLAHEMGHWLELHHTFSPGGDCYQGSCTAASAEFANTFYSAVGCTTGTALFYPTWDFVKDTPPTNVIRQNTPVSTFNLASTLAGCKAIQDTLLRCPGYPYNSDSLKHAAFNIMNYAPNQCYDADAGWGLTSGQEDRIYFALNYCRSYIFKPQNYAFTGVECVPTIAYFEKSKAVACGSGGNAQIVLTPYNNAGTGNYLWTLSEISGISTHYKSNNSGTANPVTVTFNTEIQRPVKITLRVIRGTDTISTSQTVGVHPDCESVEDFRSNMFFGQSAGLKSVENNVLPLPDTSAFLRDVAADRDIAIKGTSVTINDSVGNLQFYTVGKNLHDSGHTRLTNSLMADDNSSQYGISVPDPANHAIHLLFTVPSATGTNFSNGLRMHRLHPGSSGSNVYNTPITAGPSGAPRGNNGAVKVSEKITIVPKCEGYWLIVQGPANDATWGKRFYVYNLSNTGISFVNYYNAYHLAPKGMVKASPNSKFLVSTYSNISAGTGYGTGAFARTFIISPVTGEIKSHKELIQTDLPSGITSFGAYGVTFNKTSEWIYLSINQAKDTSTNTRFAGIYRYNIDEGSDTTVEGNLVDHIPSEFSPSEDLMLTSSGKILVSSTRSPTLNETTGNALSTEIAIIYCPENETDAGLLWNAVPVVAHPFQIIASSGGLCNFADAGFAHNTPPHGLTLIDPIDLDTNPNPCCPSPSIVNVACAGNEHLPTTTGNDIFYKFTLIKEAKRFVVDSLNGEPVDTIKKKVFNRDLSISFTNSDFEITPLVQFKRPTNGVLITLPMPFVNGYGAVNRKFLSQEVNKFPEDTAFTIIDFQVTLNANDTNATGNFKTYIRFTSNLGGYPCCRIAVDNGDKSGENQMGNSIEMVKKMKLYPNPTNGDINLEVEGKSEWYRVFDRMGRLVMTGSGFKEKTNISTAGLTSGIYRILLLGENGTQSTTFEIIR